jgi:hypothetical protein
MPLRTARHPQKSAPWLRRGRALLAVPAMLALLVAAAPAVAALYKWVDASGHVVYSDQPPPPGIKSEVVTTTAAPPSNPDAVKDLANRDLEQKKRLAQKDLDEKAAEKARANEMKKREACQTLRANLRVIQSGDPLYRIDESGKRVDMDSAAKAAERERIEGLLREQCIS